MRPHRRGDRIYFILDQDQGGGALTLSTSLADMSFAPLQPGNGILQQYFEFRYQVPPVQYRIFYIDERRVMAPSGREPGSVVVPAEHSNEKNQIWNVDDHTRGYAIVHAETGLYLDVNEASALSLAVEDSNKPSQRWSHENDGYLKNGESEKVATLGEQGPIVVRDVIHPPVAEQHWYFAPVEGDTISSAEDSELQG